MGLIGEQIVHKLYSLSRVDDNLSEIVDIKLTSAVNDNHVTYTAYVIDTIHITCPAVYVSVYPHLQDLPLAKNYMYREVEVLLSQDCDDALVPLEVRRWSKRKPFATRTMQGWSLNGPAAVEWPTSSVIAKKKSTFSIENKIHPLSIDYEKVNLLMGFNAMIWCLM